jgi:hypothetical protein
MHVKKDDIPLVAYPKDELWIEFRNQPANAVIWVSAITGTASVEIASGETDDPALLTTPTTVTLAQKGLISLTALPLGAGNLKHRYTRIKPTSGQVAVSLAAPSEFRHWMKVLVA